MRPTRFGVQAALFYLLMVAAFFAAPYSNLYFLLLAFLTLSLVAGVLGARRNLRGVRADVGSLPPVPAGSEAFLPVALRAPGRARFQVAVGVELEGGRRLVGHAGVLAGEASAALPVGGLPRGCYRVARAWVETGYPFGIVRALRPVDAPAELVIYPAPRDLVVGRSAAEALEELMEGDGTAGNLQPAELRDHRDDEDLRGVHWRASARRGRLVVQEWEGGAGHGLEVVLDRRAEPGSPAELERLERALETLSALVRLARDTKETLRIKSQDLSATFGSGHRPWNEALRFLARADALPPGAVPPPPTGRAVLRLPRAAA